LALETVVAVSVPVAWKVYVEPEDIELILAPWGASVSWATLFGATKIVPAPTAVPTTAGEPPVPTFTPVKDPDVAENPDETVKPEPVRLNVTDAVPLEQAAEALLPNPLIVIVSVEEHPVTVTVKLVDDA